MAKTTNVVQVRLGDFSCTLEGFDDPIWALETLTDYLRELSERDPVFAARIQGNWEEPAGAAPSRRRPEPEPPLAGPVADASPEAAPPSLGSGDRDDEDDDPAPDPSAHPGLQKLLTAASDDKEEELSRILSRADDQLSDPEAARRRDLMAQLKAAVAATEAERALGESGRGPAAREGAFRLDLRDAVQSQPPMPEGSHSPLKLTPSQRVDLTPPPPAEAEEEELPAAVPRQRGSFTGFASEMRASSLGDRLEAAAAWLCFVDAAESVSRAQILALAVEGLPEPPDREEGLRAFGALLREGRIVPVAGGRYRIGDGSRFDPSRLAG
jgi:hypothetical protein